METKERILIIDDSEEISNFLRESILDPGGYATLTAWDGHEGLRLALEERPDLILLDLNLPRMTGMEVLQALQARGSDIPVILMTFYGSEEVAVEAFRLGVKNYIKKPFQPQQVLVAIEGALSEERLRREKQLLTDELMRINKRLEQQVRERTMIYDIARAMAALLDLETLLSRVVEASVFLSKSDEGMLFLIDRETGELYLRAAKGVGEKHAKGLRLRVDHSLIGNVVRTGKPLRIASPEARHELKVKTGYLVNSLLYVPLKIRGEIIGVLGVSNQVTDRGFTLRDQHRLSVLADHAVIALENARLHADEDRRSSRIAMGWHISQRAASITDLNLLLAEILHLVSQNFGCYYAQVLLHDEPGYLTVREGTGAIGDKIKASSLRVEIDDRSVVGWVANNDEPLCVNDAALESRFLTLELLSNTMAELAVPLRVGGDVIGVLDVHSDQTNAFHDDDETILQILGDHIALAIQNARSHERVQRQAQELSALNKIATTVTSSPDAAEMLRRVMAGLNEMLNAEAASLLLVNQATNELECEAIMHGAQEKLTPFRLPLGRGVAGLAAQRGEPLLVNDLTGDPRYYSRTWESIGLEARSVLCAPLKVRDRVVGVIEVINKLGKDRDARFTRDDLEILTTLAASITTALPSAGLLEGPPEDIVNGFRDTLASMSQYVYGPLKALATSTYALDQLLNSMERSIEQMATLTEILNELASPESTAKDWEEVKHKLEKPRGEDVS